MCLSEAQIKDGSGMSFMIRIRCHALGFLLQFQSFARHRFYGKGPNLC